MKKLAYLALSLSMYGVYAWADNAPPAPTTTAIPAITQSVDQDICNNAKIFQANTGYGTTCPIVQNIDQDIFNNAKKFEIDAGYGNTWIPVGPIHDLNTVRLELDYFPMAFRYYNLALGIDGSYNFIEQSTNGDTSRLVIFSATPVLRYYINGTGPGIHAYTEAGVGPSYLTSKYLGDSNLGIQYAFQLLAGVGVRFNFPTYAIVTGYRFEHWSNGELAQNNGGINIPLFFYLGVQI